jgi:hypothetical protein
VREHGYREPDLFRLHAELERSGCRLLGGHFDLSRYGPLFRSDQVLAFCRDPRQQLMSHFAHAVRHNGYGGSLAEFLVSADGAGRQSRSFGQAPLDAIGFIGVTERYQESLRVIREAYGLEIEDMIQNANPERDGTQGYVVPPEMADAYAAAGARDMVMYRAANRLLDRRIAALEGGYAYVHGMIQGINHSAVRGFAFNGSDQPVAVELEINGKLAASGRASGDRPGLRAAGVPRHGYVGFDFHKRGLLHPGDQVVVKVAASGQVLGRHALKEPQEKTPS